MTPVKCISYFILRYIISVRPTGEFEDSCRIAYAAALALFFTIKPYILLHTFISVYKLLVQPGKDSSQDNCKVVCVVQDIFVRLGCDEQRTTSRHVTEKS
ncbi:hypothetical protein KQX54_018332 [Cotesia glomerata]|uniref:Uncharacterized protein n=1 Tax=Cotesia glomerata TaxID=32391 RepID=A0AAV7IF12_COTGL|nr:hypothetical protein KQX54_018332 [Cotesia glomerata]